MIEAITKETARKQKQLIVKLNERIAKSKYEVNPDHKQTMTKVIKLIDAKRLTGLTFEMAHIKGYEYLCIAAIKELKNYAVQLVVSETGEYNCIHVIDKQTDKAYTMDFGGYDVSCIAEMFNCCFGHKPHKDYIDLFACLKTRYLAILKGSITQDYLSARYSDIKRAAVKYRINNDAYVDKAFGIFKELHPLYMQDIEIAIFKQKRVYCITFTATTLAVTVAFVMNPNTNIDTVIVVPNGKEDAYISDDECRNTDTAIKVFNAALELHPEAKWDDIRKILKLVKYGLPVKQANN